MHDNLPVSDRVTQQVTQSAATGARSVTSIGVVTIDWFMNKLYLCNCMHECAEAQKRNGAAANLANQLQQKRLATEALRAAAEAERFQQQGGGVGGGGGR